VPKAEGAQPRETTVPDLEFEAVLRQASPALSLALLIAQEAGLRLGTIVRLTGENLDFQNRRIHGRTKRMHRFDVPMTTRLYERLLWVVGNMTDPKQNILAQFRENQKPYGIDALEVQLRRARERAKASSWCFHDIRRTTARKLYDATKDIRKVQRFLGHAHLRTTFWYIGNQGIGLEASEIEQALERRAIHEKNRNFATGTSH
jgi:integrase